MITRRIHPAVLTLAVVLCASPWLAAQSSGAPQGSLTWPSPPEAARIRFVQSLGPATRFARTSALSKIWRVLVGGDDEPQMRQPYGIAIGPDGRIFVADTFGKAVHVYDLRKRSHSLIRVDAQSLIGVGLAGDRLFVTDSATGRLLCLSLKGRRQWALGPRDGLGRPAGLAVAGDRLYLVDTTHHRVVMVSLDGRVLGSFGEQGGGPGQFNFPTNIARGAGGRLYVTDTMNFRVQVFDATGRYLSAFGKLGDGSGDFDKPKGVAVDSDGHVYVVEGFNDVVQIFDEAGGLLLAFGESGAGDGQFWLPSGIAIADNVIYVADSANRRVEVFARVEGPR